MKDKTWTGSITPRMRFLTFTLFNWSFCLALAYSQPSLSEDPGTLARAITPIAASANPSSASSPAADTSPPDADTKLAAILSFLGQLAWPLTTIIVVLIFRTRLAMLLEMFTRKLPGAKMKLMGVEVEIASTANTNTFRKSSEKRGDKPQIFGDPDNFRLLCKASNSRLTKSTKVMNLPGGCLVQVSTREQAADQSLTVAEALAFVPNINIELSQDSDDPASLKATFHPTATSS